MMLPDCSRTGKRELVALKHEVHVTAELDSFTIGQSEQSIVVQHGVEGLHPLRVNVTITDNPGVRLH